jgi:predicted ABC-type ATPase
MILRAETDLVSSGIEIAYKVLISEHQAIHHFRRGIMADEIVLDWANTARSRRIRRRVVKGGHQTP